MSEIDQSLTEYQLLVRPAVFIAAVFLVVWIIFGQNDAKPAPTTKLAPAPALVDLKVQPSDSSSTNLQQTSSPIDNSSDSVQSGQPTLQPAGNTSQMPSDLKQELGL